MTAAAWLARFFSSDARPETLFAPEGLWRDYLAFDWDLATYEGPEALAAMTAKVQGTLSGALTSHSETETIFEFQGPNGASKGLVELQDGKAVRLFTSLEETAEFRAQADHSRPPAVLIIGGGQSGLALGARLQALGLPYVIVDQNQRIGDNWRGRYDSLILHDPSWVNHLPFKPFPADWPVFTPKDNMGDWLEGYAADLNLNVRSNTRVQGARFDPATNRWSVGLAGGESLNVAHVVFAVGTSGFAQTPTFAGQDVFAGEQMHSSQYTSGAAYRGKRVAIIGATNSAHDIAVDLAKNGAYPTMIQRSSTHVVPHKTYVEDILAPVWGEHLNRPLKDSDFLSISLPMRRLEKRGQAIFEQVQTDWAAFYQGLRDAGMTLDFAEDGAGILGKYRRTASGYYIDVGGSARVVSGEIGLRSGVGVKALTEQAVTLSDDSVLAADVLVYATGFGSMEQWVERLIDKETADKVGPCWGYGSGVVGDPGPWEGELRNMWKPTAQTGLWFMAGNLAQVRAMSRYLALQLDHQTDH